MSAQTAVSVIIGAELGGSFKGAFGDAKTQVATLGSAIKGLDSASQNAKAFSQLKKDTAAAKAEWQSAEQRVKALSEEIAKTDKPSRELQNNLRAATKESANAKRAYESNATALGEMGKRLKDAGIDTKNLTAEQNRLGSALETLKKRKEDVAAVEAAKSRNLQTRANYRSQIMDVVALGTAIYGLVKPAVAFESAMVKVKRQVQFDNAYQIKEMESAIKKMSKTIPMSLEGLAAIVAEGGNLGVAREHLADFAETAAKMSFVMGTSATDTATVLSKFSNIMKLPADKLNDLGDVVALLSNRLAANADEIMNANVQAGSMAYTFGLSATELSALTGTFISFGNKPETAGRTINTLINRLQLLPTASDKTKATLKSLGFEMQEYENLLASGRGQEAMLKVFEALKKVEGTRRAEIMKELFGENIQRQATSMVDRLDDYRANLALATDQTQVAGYMQKDFSERAATTENNLQLLKNQIALVATNIGSALLPAINAVVGVVGKAAGTLADWADKFPVLTKVIGVAVAGLMGLKITTFAVGYAFTFVKGIGISLALAYTKVRAAVSLLKLSKMGLLPVIKAVAVAMLASPITWIIAGIAAIAGGAYLIIKYWTPISEFFTNLFAPVVQAFKGVWDWITRLWEKAQNIFKGIKEWVSDSVIGRAWRWAFGGDDKKSNKNPPPKMGDSVADILMPTNQSAVELPRSSVSTNSHQTSVSVSAPITINASPGMNAEEVAKQVSKELETREQTAQRRARGVNYD